MAFEEIMDLSGELERTSEHSSEEDEEMDLIADRLKEVRELTTDIGEFEMQQSITGNERKKASIHRNSLNRTEEP
ncbi:hypothetical protein Pst134EB_027620 [Puccinia striiformis f. sp. tritici]|nr:hypothetical protein Pst134EB_027620 [Puccinia striiformis f. sp. tritici]